MQKNSIILEDSEEIPRCLFCNSLEAIKYGFQRNKVQRYLCNPFEKLIKEVKLVEVKYKDKKFYMRKLLRGERNEGTN